VETVLLSDFLIAGTVLRVEGKCDKRMGKEGGGLCDNMELRSVQRFDKECGTPIVLYTSSRSQVLHCDSKLE